MIVTGYDVIVIGLGGMGSAAAYHLASRGQRVLGLERFGPAHDKGSSHGDSRVTRQAYFEDPAYVPLLLRAHEMWAAPGPDDIALYEANAGFVRPEETVPARTSTSPGATAPTCVSTSRHDDGRNRMAR